MVTAWNNIKRGFASSINWVINAIQTLINRINSVMGRYSPFKGVSLEHFKISASITDTSDITSAIATLETDWVNAYNEIEKAQWDLLKQTTELETAMAKIEEQGFEQWKNNIVGMIQSLKDAVAIESSDLTNTPAQQGDSNITQIDQIIINTPQQPGENQEDWVNRIREEFERMTAGQ